MARVTAEDCIIKVPNRFELVMLAAQRARNISAGAPITVERDNDKNPVVALREIADETIDLKEIENTLIKGQKSMWKWTSRKRTKWTLTPSSRALPQKVE